MIKYALLAVAFMLGTVSLADDIQLTKKKHYETKQYTHKHHKGFKHDKASKAKMQSFKHLSFLGETVGIPAKADISPLVSLPGNQGQCGSCWAWSLTKSLESEFMLAGNNPGKLEVNYLLNNCGPAKMHGCFGGSFTAAMSFESGHGPGLDALDPYTGRTGRCKHLPVKATIQSYVMLGKGSTPPSFKDLAYAVGVEQHMLSIDVTAASGDWESYSDGIYDDCQGGPRDIDHMINLVGYDCETSIDGNGHCAFDAQGKPIHGDGYLIVQNQWGEEWGTHAANGHGGYMKMRMYAPDGSHCNAIANDALMFQRPAF